MIRKDKKPKNYVDNEKLYSFMLKYKRESENAILKKLDKPRVPEYVGDCIIRIAERLSQSPNFINYTFREDMVGDGIENCMVYIDNFDPDRYKKPFAYFTQIIWYAFLRRIQKEKKNSYVKFKSLENAIVNGLINEYQESDGDQMGSVDLDSDYISNVVEDFEKKIKEKKDLKKNKKK